MSSSFQRRPGGKDPHLLPEILRQLPPDQLAKMPDAQRALEAMDKLGKQDQANQEAEVSPEIAAQLQPALGNAALAGLIKRTSDTATSNAEATQQSAEEDQEEQVEEEGEDKDAGEVERALPQFAAGATGGGGAGASPWAMSHFFGGDDDDDGGWTDNQPRWRPMPMIADPDEDVPIEDAVAEEAAEQQESLDLDEANAELGSAPWTADLLSKGLRWATKLGRRDFQPEALDQQGLDTTFGRMRALLRFMATQGEAPDAVLLARVAVGEGLMSIDNGYAGAVATQVALAELVLALCPDIEAWARLLEVVMDGRARPRVEQAAAVLAPQGKLSAPYLLAEVIGVPESLTEEELADDCHPAVRRALESVAHVMALPLIDVWQPPEEEDGDAEVAAFDAAFDALFGEPEEEIGPELIEEDLQPLYDAMNGLLSAMGLVQVEMASAGLAISSFAPIPRVFGVLREADIQLRNLARRLVGVGNRLAGLVGSRQQALVTTLSQEVVALRSTVDLLRGGALNALGNLLEVPYGESVIWPLAEIEVLAARGRTPEALARLQALAEGADGRTHLRIAGLLLTMGLGEAAVTPLQQAVDNLDEPLNAGARILAMGLDFTHHRDRSAVGHVAPLITFGQRAHLPYVVAAAAIQHASILARGGEDWRAPLRDVGAWLRDIREGGALNLLKARWGEILAAEAV